MGKIKSIWCRVNSKAERVNPIFYGVAITMIMAVFIVLFMEDREVGTTFMGWIMTVCFLGIPTFLVIMKQTDIQRDTIKYQMFDKRYQVYKAYIDVVLAMLKREDNFVWILNEKTADDVIAKLRFLRYSLHESSILATAVYDKELATEIDKIRARFTKIADVFISTLTSDEVLRDNESIKILEQVADLFIANIEITKIKQYFSRYINVSILDAHYI